MHYLLLIFLYKCDFIKKDNDLSIVGKYNKKKFTKIKEEIKSLIKDKQYSEALEIIEIFLLNNLLIQEEYKNELMLYKIDALFLNSQIQESISLCEAALEDEVVFQKYKIQIAKRFFLFKYYFCIYNKHFSEEALTFLLNIYSNDQYIIKDFDKLNQKYVNNIEINLENLMINNLNDYKNSDNLKFIVYFLSLYELDDQLIHNTKLTYWLICYLVEYKFPIKLVQGLVDKISLIYEENDKYYLESLKELEKYKKQNSSVN